MRFLPCYFSLFIAIFVLGTWCMEGVFAEKHTPSRKIFKTSNSYPFQSFFSHLIRTGGTHKPARRQYSPSTYSSSSSIYFLSTFFKDSRIRHLLCLAGQLDGRQPLYMPQTSLSSSASETTSITSHQQWSIFLTTEECAVSSSHKGLKLNAIDKCLKELAEESGNPLKQDSCRFGVNELHVNALRSPLSMISHQIRLLFSFPAFPRKSKLDHLLRKEKKGYLGHEGWQEPLKSIFNSIINFRNYALNNCHRPIDRASIMSTYTGSKRVSSTTAMGLSEIKSHLTAGSHLRRWAGLLASALKPSSYDSKFIPLFLDYVDFLLCTTLLLPGFAGMSIKDFPSKFIEWIARFSFDQIRKDQYADLRL